jgi:hypothetical protein
VTFGASPLKLPPKISDDTWVSLEESHLKFDVVESYLEFDKRAGKLKFFDFDQIGIKPDTLSGIFYRPRIAELLKFCHENPEYHIVSMTKNYAIVNGYTSKGCFYFLAEGDTNPRLAFLFGKKTRASDKYFIP